MLQRKRYLITTSALLALALILMSCSDEADPEAEPVADPADDDSGGVDFTDDTLVPVIRLVGPSSSYELQQFEANNLTLEYWQELGIRTEYETTPDWVGFTGAVAEMDWHAASAGYLGTQFRIDPDELITRPLICEAGGGGSNYGDYCNEEYDEVVRAQQRAFDLDERRELVHRAQEIQALDIPLVVSYHPADAYAWNSDAYDHVVPAVGQGLDNYWNTLEAVPAGADTTYRLGVQGTLRSINPMSAGDFNQDVDVHNLVWDTLAKVGRDGSVVEWAAESWEFVDDTTVEATLRDGLRFHDGEPVTADDVAFSYEFFRDWEVGLYVHMLSALESAEAVDERTVRFNLSEPTATFLTSTMTQIKILPEAHWADVVDREGLDHPQEWTETNLIGSGPFTISAVSATEGVELDRNDDHFNPPVVDHYQVRYFADDQGLYRAMQAGATHFHNSGRLGAPALEAAQGESHLSVESNPGITVRWMAFSFREGSPFRDYHFRNAIAHTFDSETIVNAITRGWADPGTGTIGPGNEFWHADHIARGTGDGPHWRPFDLDAARQILSDAGYRWDDDGRLHYPENYEPQIHYDD